MAKIKDLTGKKFGRLVVLNFHKSIKHRAHWLCKCYCGNNTIVASNNLRNGRNNFCGKCRRLEDSEALCLIIYRDYKHRAKSKKVEFSLSIKQFKRLISKKCYYCNAEPSNTKTRAGRSHPYNGIDRVNSKIGYTPKNSRSCCSMCNTMKMNYEETKFRHHIAKIYGHYCKVVNK